ncbi:MAG: oxidoreductase [Fodinibius sp.]|nr:oxidoreductase [Fodinibius sp.]
MSFNLDQISPQPSQVAIVTGANTGLGYETAVGLAKKQIKVIMACRNEQKADQAKSDILSEVPDADLDIMIVDLASLQSVRAFASAFKQKYQKLDLLINNAGVMVPPYSKTEDGFELQLGVNHLGHFLLTAKLIDHIPDRPESRIVPLASIAHKRGKIHFDDLQWEEDYDRQDAYAQSKLACLMFGDELNRRLKAHGKDIRAVTAHPGVSLTELSRHMPSFLINILKYTVGPFLTHPPEKGALPTLQAALDPHLDGGEYLGPQGFREMTGKPGPAERSEIACNQQTAEKLWEVSEELTDCKFTI